MAKHVDTIVVIGIKGTGKSYYAAWLFEQRVIENNYDFVILDLKPTEHLGLAELPGAEIIVYQPYMGDQIDWIKIIERHPRLIIEKGTDCTVDKFLAECGKVCKAIMQIGNRYIFVDEAHRIAPKTPTKEQRTNYAEPFLRLITEGRTNGIHVLSVTQRCAMLNSTVISESSEVIIFRLFGKNDMDWITGYIPEDMKEQVPKLENYHCLHYETGTTAFREEMAGERITKHYG